MYAQQALSVNEFLAGMCCSCSPQFAKLRHVPTPEYENRELQVLCSALGRASGWHAQEAGS